MTNEQEIRDLVQRWITAVRGNDLATTTANHTPDVVMFDVPANVRGLDAYTRTWPPFFEWLRQGAIFELQNLDITAGDDVAFAEALLRCGEPATPGDLRLTLGLRKENGGWLIAHEHHSFPQQIPDDEEIRALHEDWYEGTARKDLDGMMAHIAEDVVSYEHEAPLQVESVAEVREHCGRGLDQAEGTVTWTVPDLKVLVREDIAVAWGLNRMTHDGAESWSRGTRVFQRRNGEWLMVHQHVSFPFDPGTGQARTDLEP
ncbi:nuclear transport factor 2 family protein [Actinocrispum sp. NPDC049592]|uniref:nuclear transport factor 2 family protein n=1 Tax=Actinocrispum sp. NPDC049592 TaxID=3154835 RepID=UPI003424CAD1